MSNPLQQQLENMTPQQAVDIMSQAMGSVSGNRAEHMLLQRAESLIVDLVNKGLAVGAPVADAAVPAPADAPGPVPPAAA